MHQRSPSVSFARYGNGINRSYSPISPACENGRRSYRHERMKRWCQGKLNGRGVFRRLFSIELVCIFYSLGLK